MAEITLPVDERIADRESLGEAHKRVIDGLLAMGMELTDHIADDAGAFLEALVGIELQLLHGVDEAAVNGLEPIPHIGKRPVHDRRERIGQITLFKRVAQIDDLNPIIGGQNHIGTHGG